MNFDEIFHFLFETTAGVGVLILVGLILSIIVCAIWERATRKKYVDRGPKEDEWAVFDDDDNYGRDNNSNGDGETDNE